MVKRFVIHLMNVTQGIYEHTVNCSDEFQALGIAQGLFPKARVIDIEEVKW